MNASTNGFLQSIGLWIVTTYLQEEISLTELISTVGSEQTNLTCRTKAGCAQSNALIWQVCALLHRFIWSSIVSFSPLSPGEFLWDHIQSHLYTSEHDTWNKAGTEDIHSRRRNILCCFSPHFQESLVQHLLDISFPWWTSSANSEVLFSWYAAVASSSNSPRTNSWITFNKINTVYTAML